MKLTYIKTFINNFSTHGSHLTWNEIFPMHLNGKIFPCTSIERSFHALEWKDLSMHLNKKIFPCKWIEGSFHALEQNDLSMHLNKKIFQCTWTERYFNALEQKGLSMHLNRKIFPCTWTERSFHALEQKDLCPSCFDWIVKGALWHLVTSYLNYCLRFWINCFIEKHFLYFPIY